MNLDAMIAQAGWYHGTQSTWARLETQKQKDLAYTATGCEIAYPTWPAPVDCVHITCQIRRGEKPPLALTYAVLRSEIESGWLRFHTNNPTGRAMLARLCLAIRAQAAATHIYDPWHMPGGWQTIVYSAIT